MVVTPLPRLDLFPLILLPPGKLIGGRLKLSFIEQISTSQK